MAIVGVDPECPIMAWAVWDLHFSFIVEFILRLTNANEDLSTSIDPQLLYILYPKETPGKMLGFLFISSTANIIVSANWNSLKLKLWEKMFIRNYFSQKISI